MHIQLRRFDDVTSPGRYFQYTAYIQSQMKHNATGLMI